MVQRSWNGGIGLFTDFTGWTPMGAPSPGDTLDISAGTVVAVHQHLSDETIQLTGPVSGPPELVIAGTTIGQDTSITTSVIPQLGPPLPGSGIIQAWGVNTNLGSIAVLGSVDLQPRPASMAININFGLFQNRGTIATNNFGNLDITGSGHLGALQNNGEVDVSGHVRITAATLGHGNFQFGTAANLHGSFIPMTLEFGAFVGGGQSIDFSPFSQLQIDDLKDFHATINDFDIRSLPFFEVESIVLKGVEVTSIDYNGGPSSGVLTLKTGDTVDGRLSFSGAHTTSSFQVSVVMGDTHLSVA